MDGQEWPSYRYTFNHRSPNNKKFLDVANGQGRPTEIGLWVHGNGGWGRIIFELEDAAGQRWISLGAEMSGTLDHDAADAVMVRLSESEDS